MTALFDSQYPHIPVALERAHELLAPALSHDGAVMVDGTLGMAGHTTSFLSRYANIHVVGIDRDEEARAIAKKRTEEFASRITIVADTYDRIPEALSEAGFTHADAILLDIGVSSLQLDSTGRGFSYSQDADLDMRMDQGTGQTAEDIIREYPLAKLAAVFEKYGEEKLAMRYARAIVQKREEEAIVSTKQLVDILQEATPASLKHAGHPAKRVFQALRVEVNDELRLLEQALPKAIATLPVGGRILVMSYQSLEDRIVKRIFQKMSQSTAPIGLPIELPEHKPELKLLTTKAERATAEEIARNPRSRPLRLRAAERIQEAA